MALFESEFQELEESIRQTLENVELFDALVNEKKFTVRKDAKAFCMDVQGRERNRALRGTPEGKGPDVYTNGSKRFSLSCKDLSCRFRLELQKSNNGPFRVFMPRTNLAHGTVDTETGEEALCNVEFAPNAREVADHPLYKSQRSAQVKKRVKGSQQTSAVQQLLAVSGGCGPPTVHAVKTANFLHKVSGSQHIDGYSLLIPYLELLQQENPSMRFSVERDDKGRFFRMSLLLPYAIQAIENCFPIVGIDTAHMALVVLNGVSSLQLELAGDEPVAGRHVQEKLYVSLVSGRTLDNKMILYGYCLGYSENIEDLSYFFDFLQEHGLPLNRPEMTILTDRGGAILNTVKVAFPLALHHLCPLHLKRNVQAKKATPEIITHFWRIACATTQASCERKMQELRSMGAKGEEIFKYLSQISGDWQRWKVDKRGNILLFMMSDNVIEACFAWMIKIRTKGSAYVFCKELFLANLQRMNEMKGKIESLEKRVFMTVYAQNLYNENERKSRTYNYAVSPSRRTIVDPKGLVIVHDLGNEEVTYQYSVDFGKRTCPCLRWQQTGVPCMHAIMFLKRCNIRRLPLQARASYFYPWCMNTKLRLMLQGVEMSVPLETSVVARSLSDPVRYKMLPRTKIDNVSSKSSARIASVGESGGGSGETLAEVGRKRKAPCPHCHAVISGKTSHLAHTCNKVAARKGMNVLEGFNLEILNDLPDPDIEIDRQANIQLTEEDLEFTEGLDTMESV